MTNLEEQKRECEHIWECHCDCEYCYLEVCIKCGEQREMKVDQSIDNLINSLKGEKDGTK